VIVGGGVVLAASYEAKAHGIRTAMGGGQARRLCPQAIVVPPRMEAYSEASREVFKVFEETAPVVEALSIDEAFLDVRGLGHISGTPREIAVRLRREVRHRIGLPITVGIARTKFLAKVASRVAKPDGLLLVEPEAELDFLHPLPVGYLWGVGRVTAAKLNSRGITTVAQVAQTGERALVLMLGRAAGRHLHALAHNHDTRPVHRRQRRRSIGAQHALGRRQRRPEEIATALTALVDRVTRRLRTAGRICRTVVLRLRFGDYTRATRSFTMSDATDHTHTILTTALDLLSLATPTIERRGLTLVGVALTNLSDRGAVQLALPFDRSRELDEVVDRIRDRFGSSSVTRAILIGRDPGTWVPLLPD
jgi:DNA polymerase-4